MASSVTFSDTTANALMNSLGASGLFVSLHSANPGTTGADELSGDGYARKAATWGPASDQNIANSAPVSFGPASADWVEATYVGLWTLVTGGAFVAGAVLDSAVDVPALGEASFATGDLEFSLVPIV